MADFQNLVQLIKSNLQQNAQASLPVIPNNGNPNGANNMPAQTIPQQAAPQADQFAWLKASPSMDLIREMLAQPIQKAPVMGFPNETTAPLIPAKGGQMGFPNETTAPILPQPGLGMNMRQQARSEGDFYMMPKRGQRQGVMPQEQQSYMPTIPLRGGRTFEGY